jgi:hypothetical protein
VDATADGIPLVRVSFARVGVKVGISLVRVGIDARTTVKKEPVSTPPTRGRSSGTLVIHEGARTSSSPARGRKRKPKMEDAVASDLAATEATRAEDATVREAMARSLQDLVPADNALPMDAALAWS